MKSFLCVGALTAIGLVFACSVKNTDTSSSSGQSNTSGGTSGGTSGSTSGGTSGSTSGGTSGGPSGHLPPASAKEFDVQFNAACPQFTGCGGNLSGTYDYSAGCVGDIFKGLKDVCPTVDISGAKVTVQGTLYFLADAALTRFVTVKMTGSIKLPTACIPTAQACAAAETALKGEFPNTTCASEGSGCTCTMNETRSETSSTTFTVNGDTLTTDDGATYTICEQGSTLKYRGASAGSEDGTWELTKRQ